MKEIKDLGFGIIQVNGPKPTISKMESVDNYLCKWQKLKEWILDIWKQDLSKELSNGSKYSTKHLIHPEKLLYKMQELEGEMSKCECCKEENSDLITYKGYKMCPACYMGYVRKVKVCENNAKYETAIDQLKQQLEESFTEEDVEGLIEDRDKTIKFLQKELAEKDKEIELLKHLGNHETATEMFKENAKLIIEKRQLAIQKLEEVKDFALKNTMLGVETVAVLNYIYEQIKLLKGENYVEN